MTGVEFEKLMKPFFENIFKEMGYHVFEVRNQGSGIQNGFDIKIDFNDRNHQRRLFFIECKYYTTRLEWSKILLKQVELKVSNYNVDAFLLLSPFVDLTNSKDELQGNIVDNYLNFPVEFLTPNKGIREILALSPLTYKRIYNEDCPYEFDRNLHLKKFKEFIEHLLNYKSLPPKKQYPIPVDYIHRKVKAVYSHGAISSPVYLTELIKQHVSEVEKKNKRIVVLGVAGLGKSVELDYLAYYFSNYSENINLFPVKIRLNTITDGSIEELLLIEEPDFEKIPEEQLLVIMDGLDEIHEQSIDKVSSKIVNFSKKHSKSAIVVSSRNNFYITENKNQPAKLDGFQSYDIESLDDYSIYSYMKEKVGEKRVEVLIDKLRQNRYYDLLSSPFMLINVVAYYMEKGTIPESQSEFYEHLIPLKIDNDSKKYVNSGVSLKETTWNIKRRIQQLAVITICLGRNYIEEEEVQRTISDDGLYEKIKRAFLFNRTNGSDIWEFEHNNFKEFLAAKYLSELDFEKVIKLISFTEIHRVKPIWFNTLLFLFSILKKDSGFFLQLKNWVIANEPDILIRCEKDKLSLEVREELFLQIIAEFEEAQTIIRSPKFNKQSLVLFVQDSEKLIEILLGKISSIENELFTSEILEILPYFTHINKFKEEIKSVLLDEICNTQIDERAKYNLLNCLSKLNISDEEITRSILKHNDLTSSIYIRVGFYKYLEKSIFIDDYVWLLKDGVELINHKDTSLYDNIYQEEKSLIELLFEKIQTSNSVKYLIQHILNEKLNYNKIDGFFSEFIKIVLNLATKQYNKGEEIFFELVLELLEKIHTEYRRLNYELKTFFVETNTEFKAFKILHKRYILKKRTPLGIVCNEDAVAFLVKEIKHARISEEKILLLRSTISWDASSDIFNLLQSELLKIDKEKYYLYTESNEDLQKRQKQRDIELLLDKKIFLAEVENVFKSESNNNELTFKQVYDANKDCFNNNKMNNQIVANTIGLFVKEKKNVRLSQIIDFVNTPKRWEWFVLHRLIQFDTESKIFEFDEASNNFLEKWVLNNIDKANFKTGISIKNGNHYYNYLETYLSYFIQRLDIDLPEHVLFELIHVDYFLPQKINVKYRTYDFLVNKLGEEKLKNYVLENLLTLELLPVVKLTHFEFAYKLNLYESTPYIFNELLKVKEYQEHEQRRLVVHFIELGGDKNKLVDIIDIFSEDVQLFIVGNLINQDYGIVKGFIQKKIEVDRNETYLILLTRNYINDGFSYLKEWILSNKKLPENHIDYNSLDNEYLPGLIEIFDDSMVNDYGSGEWINRSQLLSPMIELASNNEQDFYTLSDQFRIWLKQISLHETSQR